LYEHPWLSLLAMMMATLVSMAIVGTVTAALRLSDQTTTTQFVQQLSFHLLTCFLFAPFVLHLPKEKRTYRQFLDDIGFTRVQPFFQLVLLALSCCLIMMLSQVAASFLYRLTEGLPITWSFIRQAVDVSRDLPPGSPSLFISFPSAFEEVAFRGIVLTVFLNKYSERNSIIFSSISFALMHLLNLTHGADLIFTMGQVVWAFILGLFYGYVFVKTRSLLPPMIVHYLGNVFISSLVGYIQTRASMSAQVLYGVTLSQGIVPVSLMILWTRFYVSRWLTRNMPQASTDG
jgi:membrane protease YdiL (CAAX protease family)